MSMWTTGAGMLLSMKSHCDVSPGLAQCDEGYWSLFTVILLPYYKHGSVALNWKCPPLPQPRVRISDRGALNLTTSWQTSFQKLDVNFLEKWRRSGCNKTSESLDSDAGFPASLSF